MKHIHSFDCLVGEEGNYVRCMTCRASVYIKNLSNIGTKDDIGKPNMCLLDMD